MSKLIDFYLEEGTDTEGRTFTEIMAWSDEKWEFGHDYIQWMFPLQEESNFNPDAPLLTEEDIRLFHANPDLRNNMVLAFHRFVKFLGLKWLIDPMIQDATVIKAGNFQERRWMIWDNPNHNWFRISRVLKSLKLLGLKEYADDLFACLKRLHEDEGLVTGNSFRYWQEAVALPTKSE
jgi:hypothetical protein